MIVCGIYTTRAMDFQISKTGIHTHAHIYKYIIYTYDMMCVYEIIYYINTILSRVARAKIISRALSRRKSSPFTISRERPVVGGRRTY